MAKRLRFITLLCGVVGLIVAAYFAISEHIIPVIGFLKAWVLAFGKKVMTRAFWEAVPLFLGKWSLKATLKFVFIQVPMTLIVPYASVMLLQPRTRVRIRWWLREQKELYLGYFNKALWWFDHYFGSGMLSFILSAIAAALMLVGTFVYFDGFAFFVWLGSWGPIAPFWSWCWGMIVWMAQGTVNRLPFLGRIMAWGAEVWTNTIAKRFPELAHRHRMFVIWSLRHAQRTRVKNMIRRDKLERGLRRARRERQKKQRELQDRQFLRYMWTSASRPLWERRGWSPNIFAQLQDQALHDSVDRLYMRQQLGADVHQSVFEGGHTPWRTLRR